MLRFRSCITLFASLFLLHDHALASPEVREIVMGDVTHSVKGHETIFRSGNQAIINFERFNIKGHESVKFLQKNARSRLLARVVGAESSLIDGALFSNGILYLVNPAGVIFGKNSVIRAHQFYAAAAHLSDDHFLDGKDLFTSAAGAIRHEGQIYAGAVHLIAQQIESSGSISAPKGAVTMTVGDQVLISNQEGSLYVKVFDKATSSSSATIGAADVYSLCLKPTAHVQADKVVLEGGGSAQIAVSGTIDVSSANHAAGEIWITGQDVSLKGASLLATSDEQGGKIYIGGELGGGGFFSHAQTLTLDADTRIIAHGRETGDGGRVILFADHLLDYSCSVDLSGGLNGGAGGFLETSAAHIERDPFRSHINLDGGVGGHVGQWLVDPTGPIFITTQAQWDTYFGAVTGRYSFLVTGQNPTLTIGDGFHPLQADFSPSAELIVIQTYDSKQKRIGGQITIHGIELNRHSAGQTQVVLQTQELQLQGAALPTAVVGTPEKPAYLQAETVKVLGNATIAFDGSNLFNSTFAFTPPPGSIPTASPFTNFKHLVLSGYDATPFQYTVPAPLQASIGPDAPYVNPSHSFTLAEGHLRAQAGAIQISTHTFHLGKPHAILPTTLEALNGAIQVIPETTLANPAFNLWGAPILTLKTSIPAGSITIARNVMQGGGKVRESTLHFDLSGGDLLLGMGLNITDFIPCVGNRFSPIGSPRAILVSNPGRFTAKGAIYTGEFHLTGGRGDFTFLSHRGCETVTGGIHTTGQISLTEALLYPYALGGGDVTIQTSGNLNFDAFSSINTSGGKPLDPSHPSKQGGNVSLQASNITAASIYTMAGPSINGRAPASSGDVKINAIGSVTLLGKVKTLSLPLPSGTAQQGGDIHIQAARFQIASEKALNTYTNAPEWQAPFLALYGSQHEATLSGNQIHLPTVQLASLPAAPPSYPLNPPILPGCPGTPRTQIPGPTLQPAFPSTASQNFSLILESLGNTHLNSLVGTPLMNIGNVFINYASHFVATKPIYSGSWTQRSGFIATSFQPEAALHSAGPVKITNLGLGTLGTGTIVMSSINTAGADILLQPATSFSSWQTGHRPHGVLILTGNIQAGAGHIDLAPYTRGSTPIPFGKDLQTIQPTPYMNVATIYNLPVGFPTALSISGGSFSMGPQESMTTFGPLNLNMQRYTTLGDINSLGNISINSPSIYFIPHDQYPMMAFDGASHFNTSVPHLASTGHITLSSSPYGPYSEYPFDPHMESQLVYASLSEFYPLNYIPAFAVPTPIPPIPELDLDETLLGTFNATDEQSERIAKKTSSFLGTYTPLSPLRYVRRPYMALTEEFSHYIAKLDQLLIQQWKGFLEMLPHKDIFQAQLDGYLSKTQGAFSDQDFRAILQEAGLLQNFEMYAQELQATLQTIEALDVSLSKKGLLYSHLMQIGKLQGLSQQEWDELIVIPH